MDVVIRKMREEDRPTVMKILAVWNMAPMAPTPERPDPERSTIAADGTAFVALSGEQLIGVASYILYDRQRAETASLAVDPAWRGSGVGEQLQVARLVELKARGIEVLRTECDRPEVVDWYVRKFGYRVVGTSPKKHAFSLETADCWTVLELDLKAWQPTP
jgi:N-acetylglutamate synthase-like GNAT family acetyltransferase